MTKEKKKNCPVNIKRLDISVIIPTYNRCNIINKAIDSVLHQTIRPFEIIVVDDGSIDGTEEIINKNYNNISYIYQKNNGGASARNLGVKNAKGNWIAFLDSDDYWKRDHLEFIVKIIKKTNQKADIYFSNVQRTTDENQILLWDACKFSLSGEYMINKSPIDWAAMERQPFMLQSSVIRKEKFIQLGGLNEKLLRRHDTHFFFKICMHGIACAVNNVGTVMTSIDRTEARLNVKYDNKSEQYWKSLVMGYLDIMKNSSIHYNYLKTIKKRTSLGYLNLCKLSWKSNIKVASIHYFFKSLITSPHFIYYKIKKKLLDYI